jgi:hypothetical protein
MEMTDATLTREDLREELGALREDLRQELAPMQTQLAALPIIQQELSRLHTEVRALRIETLAHGDVMNTLQSDVRMLQAAINDILIAAMSPAMRSSCALMIARSSRLRLVCSRICLRLRRRIAFIAAGSPASTPITALNS